MLQVCIFEKHGKKDHWHNTFGRHKVMDREISGTCQISGCGLIKKAFDSSSQYISIFVVRLYYESNFNLQFYCTVSIVVRFVVLCQGRLAMNSKRLLSVQLV